MQISAKDLTIGYRRTAILSEINVSIHKGNFWGIVGPNGTGKTTLVKTLLGIIRPLNGLVDRAPSVRFGYVPLKPGYYVSWERMNTPNVQSVKVECLSRREGHAKEGSAEAGSPLFVQ